MLRLLLDEHISPSVAQQLIRRKPGVYAVPLQEWERGSYLGAGDDIVLAGAREQGLTLVTYDRRTIAPLLRSWADRGIDHAGVIFVDDRTLAPNDIRGLVRSLQQLWNAQQDLDWRNRCVFLQR